MLMCDQLQLTSPEQVLNALSLPVTFSRAGFVPGSGGERFQVGSVECSCHSPLSPPALLLSVPVASLACGEAAGEAGKLSCRRASVVLAVRTAVSISVAMLLTADSSQVLVRFFCPGSMFVSAGGPEFGVSAW